MLCFKNWLKQSKKQFHLYPHCADSIPVLLTEARCPFIKPIFLLEKRHQIFIGKKHPSIQTQGVGIILRQKKTNLMFLAFAISSGQSFLLRNGGDPKGARHCGNNPFFENLFYLEFPSHGKGARVESNLKTGLKCPGHLMGLVRLQAWGTPWDLLAI